MSRQPIPRTAGRWKGRSLGHASFAESRGHVWGSAFLARATVGWILFVLTIGQGRLPQACRQWTRPAAATLRHSGGVWDLDLQESEAPEPAEAPAKAPAEAPWFPDSGDCGVAIQVTGKRMPGRLHSKGLDYTEMPS